MQKTDQSFEFPLEHTRGMVKVVQAQNGGTKGHSKPSIGGKQAGPPPPPQPPKNKN